MGFLHRKLMSDDETSCDSTTCYNCVILSCSPSSPCFKVCRPYLEPPTPPLPPVSDSGSHIRTSTMLLIITFAVLSTAFLVLCYYVYYVRRSRRARMRSQPETTETRDQFLDEDHGPIVDHHIWYINTVGLQRSIIDSIAVFKYKKGEGLVEGTECAVCLSEFEEDENLRLLPKCSHAFHIPCIDTWLRSHTNCPLCRAPIVSNTANIGPSSSSEVNTEESRVSEETQVVIVEDDYGEPHRETDTGTSEIRNRPDEEEGLAVENERNTGESSGGDDGVQPMRRSVSLDSMAASQISQALPNGIPEGSNGNLDSELDKAKESSSSVRIVSRRSAGNQSLLRLMYNSSIGRSLQNRPISMKRSFSCNGKFSLPIRNTKSSNTNRPLRSF
ncbi:hypothetical protein PTKIN_Ptkin02bG0154800 [Pterospermum kingtungense]